MLAFQYALKFEDAFESAEDSMKLLLVSLILLNCLMLKAESAVGNGGVGIICYENENIKSSELVDYVEGQYFNKTFVLAQINIQNIFPYIIDRISPISPNRAKKYKKYIDSFFAESSHVFNSDIIDPLDSYNYISKEDCFHKTVVLQSKIDNPLVKKYLIQMDYFQKMNALNQAMTVLHEVIYREAISYGHTNSEFTRELNYNLFSDQWYAFSQSGYLQLLKKYNIPLDAE